MDNSLRMAIILLLQREDYEIKREIQLLKSNPIIDEDSKKNIIFQRKERIKAVNKLINKIKIDISDSNDKHGLEDMINTEETKSIDEEEIERKIINEIFGQIWFGRN